MFCPDYFAKREFETITKEEDIAMGLLSFVKSVGEKVFGASEANAAPADQLKKEAEKHGLDLSKVDIKVDGDKVVLSGAAVSTEQAEKIALAVGNSVGVSSVQNNLTATKAEPESKFYTVKSGDTLWKIAEVEYGRGHGAKYTVIFEANKPLLSNADKIYPGQVLRIPPLAA
jgi:nucleoid-associated protein YgaU